MDINEFKLILSAFADEPSDVDIRHGKVVAQIREDIIDISISFDNEMQLIVEENGQKYVARLWLLNRIAKLPQLADRIISSTHLSPEAESKSPFVTPSAILTPDISLNDQVSEDIPKSDAVSELLIKASNPLPGATSVLYITSDAGEGKTTIINYAARQQAMKFKERKSTALIVPIPLGGRTFLTFDDAVIAALVNKLRFSYLYFDAFIHLVRLGAIVPAFDGYEEMLVEGSKNEAVSALGNLVQNLDSAGTVFIAARKAFFEYHSFKTQAKLLDAIGDRSASFSRLAISRWNKQQFCEYGKKRKVDNPEEIYQTVENRLGSDHPLLTRAVLVRRLYDVTTEKSKRKELAEMLGSNPVDYFYTFVDAIVNREASEKWLSRVAGEVMEPLINTSEHHELLSLIAMEMWQSSSSSLKYDVMDVLVDIFADSHRKNSSEIRQIKERLKQHSLLIADSARGQAITFDHEDFQNFYIGEGLGRLLVQGHRSDLQSFLSVNLLSSATVEQSVQYLVRTKSSFEFIISTLSEINSAESGISFCKENCSTLLLRIIEFLPDRNKSLSLKGMFFSPDALAGKNLKNIEFFECHFQPTSISKSIFINLKFEKCEFERIEIQNKELSLSSCEFINCRMDSLINTNEDEYLFDPSQISKILHLLGARFADGDSHTSRDTTVVVDEKLKLLERFLRVFLRTSQVDEEVIRKRLGNANSQKFFDEILPDLIKTNILEEVPWRGRGVQHRYKLAIPMSTLSDSLEKAYRTFDEFMVSVAKKSS